MTKKDYELIARNIRHYHDVVDGQGLGKTSHWVLDNLADAIAGDLALDNGRFNRETFIRACRA